MKKWRKKAAAGLCLVMTAGILSGCLESEREKETSKAKKEPKKERQEELTETEHPRFVPDGIRKLVLTEEGKEIFCLSKEPEEYKLDFDYWEILNPYDETVTVNTEKMYELFETLSSLEFQEPVQGEEEIDAGIWDSETSFTVEFVDTADQTEAKKTSEADSQATVLLGNSDGAGKRYAAVKGYEEQLYKVPEEQIQSVFSLNPFDYILKIPVLVGLDTVSRIELSGEGWEHEMEADVSRESYKLDKKKTDKETFAGLYQELSGIILEAELEEPWDSQGKEPELKIVFQRNTEDAPEIETAYYSYKGELDAVEVNGNCRFLVKREDVERLIEILKNAF